MQEARAAGRLAHSNIVSIYDVDDVDGHLFIVMEVINGPSLTGVLTEIHRVEPGRAADIALQVAAALDYAHSLGVIHCDVKPGNVLVADGGRAKLTDFGIARIIEGDQQVTQTQTALIGTPAYMAPESISGRPVPASDQYALAALLFELLAGHPPFQADTAMAVIFAHVNSPIPRISAVAKGIPSALDRVLARGLAKRQDLRYPSCSAFAEDVRRVVALSQGAQSATRSRSRTIPFVAVGIVALLIVGASLAGSGDAQRFNPATRANSLVISPTADAVIAIAANESLVRSADASQTPARPNPTPSPIAPTVSPIVLSEVAAMSVTIPLLTGVLTPTPVPTSAVARPPVAVATPTAFSVPSTATATPRPSTATPIPSSAAPQPSATETAAPPPATAVPPQPALAPAPSPVEPANGSAVGEGATLRWAWIRALAANEEFAVSVQPASGAAKAYFATTRGLVLTVPGESLPPGSAIVWSVYVRRLNAEESVSERSPAWTVVRGQGGGGPVAPGGGGGRGA